MHTYTAKYGTVFNYNGDFSGNVIARPAAWPATWPATEIPCADLLEFAIVTGQDRKVDNPRIGVFAEGLGRPEPERIIQWQAWHDKLFGLTNRGAIYELEWIPEAWEDGSPAHLVTVARPVFVGLPD